MTNRAAVTREDVRRQVDAARGFAEKYHRWVPEQQQKLIKAIWKLVMDEGEVADQLALILEQEQ